MRFDFHFLDLAAPDHRGGVDLIAHLKNASRDLRARAASKLRQFLERRALSVARLNPRHVRRPLQAHAHQEHALVAFCRTCSLHSVAIAEIQFGGGQLNWLIKFTQALYNGIQK